MRKVRRVYTSVFMLEGYELYSDGANDPIIMAMSDAEDVLAYGDMGEKLPYSISCSIFTEDVRGKCKIGVHVTVYEHGDDVINIDRFNQ
jgi:hypothetical protein